MIGRRDLQALRAKLKAFLKKNADVPQPLSRALQTVICAINTALTNPHAPEFTSEWLREARRDFEAAV